MNFDLTKEQQILKTAARDFLKKECPVSLRQELVQKKNRFPAGLWRKMADLDWMGITIPERYGGIGGDFMDLALILEEMGRNCCPGPFFSSAVTSTLLILEFGTEEQKAAILPDMAKGDRILTAALQESNAVNDASYTKTTAQRTDDGFKLNGTKLFVENATSVDTIVCCTKADNDTIGLFMVDPSSSGVTISSLDTLAFDDQCEVVLADAPGTLLGDSPVSAGRLVEVRDRCTVAKCAEMIGIVQATLDKTVDYAKQRKQFNQPIGSFQAIQHHCTNMLMDADCARYLTWSAASKIQQGTVTSADVSMAKIRTNLASRKSTFQGHLLHGAIAFCDEHDMHLHYRTAKAGETAFGMDETHLNRIASQLFEG